MQRHVPWTQNYFHRRVIACFILALTVKLISNTLATQQEQATHFKKAFIQALDGLIDSTSAKTLGYTIAQDENYTLIRKLQEQLRLK